MILGYLPGAPPDTPPGPSRGAFPVFAAAEKSIRPPCAIVYQAKHATLAGALAAALLEDTFGELGDQAIQAAGQHDFGWQSSDMRQMDRLGHAFPKPFPALDLPETLASWRACIDHAATVSPVVEALVSRHFTMLGRSDPQRAAFVRAEEERRARLEQGIAVDARDLDRWTAALGFCDILSLYLCCGVRDPVDLRLAHPADPAAASAPKVTLRWEDRSPYLSRPVVKPGAEMSLLVRAYDGHGARTRPLSLGWSFPRG
jgi:hypothetical protein